MFRFFPEQRIRRSLEFKAFRAADVVRCKFFVLKILGRTLPSSIAPLSCCSSSSINQRRLLLPRLGIVTSKKVGNAVTRNKIRRVIREAFRKNPNLFRELCDYLLIVLKPATNLSNKELMQKFLETTVEINNVLPPK